ncbi:MAG: M16 family metallopeptidase, partial [Blastocatellia bacterium]
MKKLIRKIAIVSAVLSMLAVSVPAQQQGQRPIDRLKYPPLKFTPPVAQKVVLPNGTTVFLLEDSELPLVNMFALIRTGGRLDPPGKAGLAQLTATVLRTGGTKSLKPDEINQKLEFVAASVETDMDTQYGTASLSTLSKDLDTVLPVFADVLMNPGFDQGQIEIARGQMLDAIKRQNDSPQEIAQRVFPQIIYGRHSPLAESPTEESVKSITRDDIEAFYRQYYSAGDVTLGISGDIHKDAILKKIEDAFAGWK